ncbi:GntR family transcriptional regulator [Kribbella sp. VKM Ac-2568]|uniref:GntR family transcriptional regulator n=1 Tax=Kribbella sp. VKM Ac-2568 TaxID=2512219 RepID=UPI0010D01A86|nr:GntR family transcriptional regulator [Kribbella sp. VKM Ac-2568]TCM35146.1 regulatory GntR family protein [Kribbella sp. VKM Ac-2568]
MPTRPTTAAPTVPFDDFKPTSPYEHTAVALRAQILEGTLRPGLPIPPIKQIATDHDTSVGTAQRAVKLLADWGLVELNSGRRTIVKYAAAVPTAIAEAPSAVALSPGSLDLEVRQLGAPIANFRADADPEDNTDLRALLVGAIRRSGGSLSEISDYELVVYLAGSPTRVTTFVATR